MYRDAFAEVLGSGVVGTPPNERNQERFWSIEVISVAVFRSP